MGKIIVPNAVVRKKGFLYYINGNGDLCESQMARGRKKGSGKVKKAAKKPAKKTVLRKLIKKVTKKR